jgi:thioredoxin-related protein
MGCVISKPIVNGIEQDYGKNLQVVHLDARNADNRAIAAQIGVMMTPTYVLFDANGTEVWRAAGAFSRPQFDTIAATLGVEVPR